MLLDIIKGLTVIAIYMAVVVGGIALARYVDRRRHRDQGGSK
ncbi:MAG TPA: hypothetical protein VLT60_00020 [Usitatibacter sp.]|nr:hypothetical protein [Usitatibacter sp.]